MDYNYGGLKVINLDSMQKSFLLQWAVRLYKDKEEKWTIPTNDIFKEFGNNYVCFFSNCKSKTFKNIETINSHFWQNVLKTWLDNNKNEEKISLIWNNNDIKYQNKTLQFSSWIKNGINLITDVYQNSTFITFDEICRKIGNAPSRLLEYFTVRNAVMAFIRQNNDLNQLETIDLTNPPKFFGKNILKCKEFRETIDNASSDIPHSIAFWERKYNITINENHWLIIRKSSSEQRVRLLHWKILMNIYPTNILLNKMGLRNSNLCTDCNEVDYIEHFFFKCPKIKKVWESCEAHIVKTTNKTVKLTETDVLFGYDVDNAKKSHILIINHLIIIAKMCIGKFRYGKSYDIQCIFENEVQIRRKFFEKNV